jgi:hypothetical protein
MGRATIGTDPEFFMQRKKDGKLISAVPYINGTKDAPEPLENGGNVQFDNVAIEFATDPAESGEDLVLKIRNAFTDIMKKLPEGHSLVVEPSANFDPDQLETDEAQQFGCDPDFCAWGIKVNDAPFCSDLSLRTCGGHIHVGKNKDDGNDFLCDPMGKITVVRIMDVFHGIISVILDRSEKAITRRKLYGKAGCHRPVDLNYGGLYNGVEYRVLSNFWFKSPNLVMLMESLTQDALKAVREMDHESLISEIGEELIQNTINEGLIEIARDILEKYVRPLLSKDSVHYLDMCMEEIDNYEFTEEWKLEV